MLLVSPEVGDRTWVHRLAVGYATTRPFNSSVGPEAAHETGADEKSIKQRSKHFARLTV